VRHSKAEIAAAGARPADVRLVAPAANPTIAAPARVVVPPTPLTAPGDVAKHGWLRVGGAALVGARVTADGALVGYAPLELSLPVGNHLLVVTSKTGHVLMHRHLHLGEAQTRLAPLRILR
jgi:hypothetical protein